MKDNCVRCGAETPYDRNTDIAMRLYYVECVGQHCPKCYALATTATVEPEFLERLSAAVRHRQTINMTEADIRFARELGLDPSTLELPR
jgi:hypothetical protein